MGEQCPTWCRELRVLHRTALTLRPRCLGLALRSRLRCFARLLVVKVAERMLRVWLCARRRHATLNRSPIRLIALPDGGRTSRRRVGSLPVRRDATMPGSQLGVQKLADVMARRSLVAVDEAALATPQL